MLDSIVADTPLGALGGVIIGDDADDALDVPPELVAVTVNV